MQETVAEVITELQAFLNGALATQAYAALGLFHERELLQGIPITAENPDPTIHIGVADPNESLLPTRGGAFRRLGDNSRRAG